MRPSPRSDVPETFPFLEEISVLVSRNGPVAMLSCSMPESRLEQARRHVERGRLIIERQRNLITRTRALGHDAAMAESLLAAFERSQDVFERDLRDVKKRG